MYEYTYKYKRGVSIMKLMEDHMVPDDVVTLCLRNLKEQHLDYNHIFISPVCLLTVFPYRQMLVAFGVLSEVPMVPCPWDKNKMRPTSTQPGSVWCEEELVWFDEQVQQFLEFLMENSHRTTTSVKYRVLKCIKSA